MRVPVLPNEADAVLVVDPDAVLTTPVSAQSLQVVAWKRPQVLESVRRVQHHELALRDASDAPESARRKALKQGLRLSIPEGPDHLDMVFRVP
jgi:hypothetical protein